MVGVILFALIIFGAIGLAYVIPYPWSRALHVLSVPAIVVGISIILLAGYHFAQTHEAAAHGTPIPASGLGQILGGSYNLLWLGILLMAAGMCGYLGFWFRDD